MTNKKILKKLIIYRSNHRGTKEMDLLLGGFVKKYINTFNETDLLDLKCILAFEDEILHKWYFDNDKTQKIPKNNITKLLKSFKL